ncbi:hypothetical protein BDZ89DRAFT_1044827 [Hymenopellis radicata]|nr:hypothetical protein BDZ89DRAFT_1044827 [Hymenopellis radicata]
MSIEIGKQRFVQPIEQLKGRSLRTLIPTSSRRWRRLHIISCIRPHSPSTPASPEHAFSGAGYSGMGHDSSYHRNTDRWSSGASDISRVASPARQDYSWTLSPISSHSSLPTPKRESMGDATWTSLPSSRYDSSSAGVLVHLTYIPELSGVEGYQTSCFEWSQSQLNILKVTQVWNRCKISLETTLDSLGHLSALWFGTAVGKLGRFLKKQLECLDPDTGQITNSESTTSADSSVATANRNTLDTLLTIYDASGHVIVPCLLPRPRKQRMYLVLPVPLMDHANRTIWTKQRRNRRLRGPNQRLQYSNIQHVVKSGTRVLKRVLSVNRILSTVVSGSGGVVLSHLPGLEGL